MHVLETRYDIETEDSSVLARSIIHDLRPVYETLKTRHKSQVRLIVLHIVISVSLILEFDHECMRESVLDRSHVSKQQICVKSNESRKTWSEKENGEEPSTYL